MTREEKALYMREYMKKNKDKVVKYNATRLAKYHRNKEAVSAKRRAERMNWTSEQVQKDKDNKRRSYLRNSRQRCEYTKAWARANPDKVRDLHLQSKIKRRTKLKSVKVERISRKAIFQRDGGRCIYCDTLLPEFDWHLDHIVPLCANGDHVPDNVAVSCSSCNLSKGKSLDWAKGCRAQSLDA